MLCESMALKFESGLGLCAMIQWFMLVEGSISFRTWIVAGGRIETPNLVAWRSAVKLALP